MESNDGVSAANGPEHSRLFEFAGDDGSTSGLDDAGTYKEMLAAEVWIAHRVAIPFKVIRLDTRQVGGIGGGSGKRT